MSDLISRQAAQDLLDRVGAMHPYRQIGNGESYGTYNEAWTDAINMADAELNSLPSSQPEPKKGKWIIRDNPGTGWYQVTCSECGEDVTSTIPMIGFFPNATPLWDYCPYCGAKMEVEDNGKQ